MGLSKRLICIMNRFNVSAVIVLSMAMLSLTACGGIDTVEWSEDVKLHDGKLIVVKMQATRGSSGFPDSRRGGYRLYEIRFPSPLPVWSEEKVAGMVPIAIEINDGIPYVVVLIGHCNICNELGNPDPSLIVWKWNDGRWQRARYDELPKDTRLNIIGEPWDVLHHEGINQLDSVRRDLTGHYPLIKKFDDICRFDSCKDTFNRLLSEYVEGKPGQYHPGKVCVEVCQSSQSAKGAN